MNEPCTDAAECHRKVASGRKVAGTIRSLVNGKGRQLECVGVMHEVLLLNILLYGSETMILRKGKV